MEQNFIKQYLLPLLKTWIDEKRNEGLIPTVELLVEELEAKLNKDND